jgi:hypothetical protein
VKFTPSNGYLPKAEVLKVFGKLNQNDQGCLLRLLDTNDTSLLEARSGSITFTENRKAHYKAVLFSLPSSEERMVKTVAVYKFGRSVNIVRMEI